jgi:MEDS: MEthanogen/methylotroph, DcmR Sensory domain
LSFDCKHVAQFYGRNERFLVENIGRYLSTGLRSGEGLVVITTDDRRAALFRELEDAGVAPAKVIREGRFTIAETNETLAQLYYEGQLSYLRFDHIAGKLIREMRARPGVTGVRAYGDMVGALWEAGDRAAAIHLEEFWNRLQTTIPFSLLCAYPLDNSAKMSDIEGIVLAHSHWLTEGEGLDAVVV